MHVISQLHVFAKLGDVNAHPAAIAEFNATVGRSDADHSAIEHPSYRGQCLT